RRSLILSLVLFLMTLSLPTFGDDQASPTDNSDKQESSSRPRKQSTKAELELLRSQVASQQKAMESQQKTNEELKTMVGQLDAAPGFQWGRAAGQLQPCGVDTTADSQRSARESIHPVVIGSVEDAERVQCIGMDRRGHHSPNLRPR